MQVIKVDFPINNSNLPRGPVVLVLGFFDGVHLGHQRLITIAKKEADNANLPLMVMTFDVHPRVYFAHDADFKYITSLETKAKLMQNLGVDYLVVFDFAQGVGELGPQEFVDQVIVPLNATTVVAGFDYTYGDRSIANMANLPKFGKGRFKIVEVPEQIIDAHKIGSSSIRHFLEIGDIEEANRMLGYPFCISGKVVPGKQRGRQLGFRTANLEYPPHQQLPTIGVYATKLRVDGKWHDAMTSVGYNVTFENEKKIFIETNIFNFDEDIYGKEITVAWYKFIRGEIKFSTAEELVDQLKMDQTNIKNFFAQPNKTAKY